MKTVIKRTATAFALGSFFWISFLFFPPFILTIALCVILGYIVTVEMKNLFPRYNRRSWLILPWYPVLPFAMLMYLNHHPEYRTLLFVLFIIISSLDMGSYVVGNLIGKHKIVPSISPHKTWEGFFGGFACAIAGVWLVLWEMGSAQSWWFIGGFTLIICALGLIGDLFESWLKRKARIKDSGDILPGHGGFLDRFDGILFATFFFFLLRDWLIKIF